MNLLDIPDEAWNKACGAAERARTATLPGTDPMPAVLAAAWPHLYAAALRHAADELDMGDGTLMQVASLRHLADEATK